MRAAVTLHATERATERAVRSVVRCDPGENWWYLEEEGEGVGETQTARGTVQ